MNNIFKNIDSSSSDYWSEIDGLTIDYDPSIEELFTQTTTDPNRLLWLSVIYVALEDLGIIRRKHNRAILYSEWLDARNWVTNLRPRGDFAKVCNDARVPYLKLNKHIKSLKCPCCRRSYLKKPCKSLDIKYDNQPS